MSPSIPAFRPLAATRCSFWSTDSFSLWATDDALCGLRNHKQSSSAVVTPFDLLPLGLDVGILGLTLCLVAVVLFIPIAILLHFRSEQKQRKAQEIWDWMDPTSKQYLMWDHKNFRLDLSRIEQAEFFEPKVNLSLGPPAQKLRLYLDTGEKWHFTLAKRQDAEELQSLLAQRAVPTTRQYSQSLSSYVTDVFGGP